jgi:hypothetical protein
MVKVRVVSRGPALRSAAQLALIAAFVGNAVVAGAQTPQQARNLDAVRVGGPAIVPNPPPVAADVSMAPPVLVGDAPPVGTSAQVRPNRPRFDVAVGMGMSFDSTGLVDGRTVAVPAFQVSGGVGAQTVGFEARLFSTQASGRYFRTVAGSDGVATKVDMAADRLALDVMVALRPFASKHPGDTRWFRRAQHSVTINLGLAGENVSVAQKSVKRVGAVAGIHVDVPLTPASLANELRFRLAVRRMFAGSSQAGPVQVGDSREDVFAALVAVF